MWYRSEEQFTDCSRNLGDGTDNRIYIGQPFGVTWTFNTHILIEQLPGLTQMLISICWVVDHFIAIRDANFHVCETQLTLKRCVLGACKYHCFH